MSSTPVHPRAGGERRALSHPRMSSNGSSPRGRGTPAPRTRPPGDLRFIPARAGNARSHQRARTRSSVHPRAGGERLEPGPLDAIPDGSSPRGRGTPGPEDSARRPSRFIPARAGNARTRGTSGRRRTVHPRAGGERLARMASTSASVGSSPRGRGTRRQRSPGVRRPRFIPARAGNARATSRRPGVPPVHPRAGGERGVTASRTVPPVGSSPRGRGTPWLDDSDANLADGSSPRGRGTPGGHGPPRRRGRFIPARAGNARLPRRRSASRSVHPRAGGERACVSSWLPSLPGSSPRGRGTPHPPVEDGVLVRFIPARAGNAQHALFSHPRAPVHPRAGGERREPGRAAQTGNRFIPARAGNADWWSTGAPRPSVHPRAGGERFAAFFAGAFRAGSSPRGRGTRQRQPAGHRRRRFIPARAGNARTPWATRGTSPVHPRAGGERTIYRPVGPVEIGSSPRGRGTRCTRGARKVRVRFIPARAGNARRS